jgi:PKD repeat protein
LQVQASDPQGANLSYAWSVQKPKGTITPKFDDATSSTPNVTFGQAGTYTFTVTVTNAFGLSTTSSVTVTVVQTLSRILVTPGSVTLADSATQQFSAVARDQFGYLLATQPTFSWQVNSNNGTISTNGLYTAPASGTGGFPVQATAGGKTGQAYVIVT